MRATFTAQIVRKVFHRVTTRLQNWPLKWRDRARTTYLSAIDVPAGELNFKFNSPPRTTGDHELVLELTNRYTHHQFDIYGSGWRLSTATQLPRHSSANVPRAADLRAQIQGTYVPIGWHQDLQTGFTWESDTWFQDIAKRGIAGDVRRPWELARAHHWPQLARAFGYSRDPTIVAEIQNQFYDFVATNPPRYGVNWSSPMDVAIRASNWLLAVDLLQAYGGKFSTRFALDFKISIFEHGRHLRAHLEATPSDRANHYLANICGLIFISIYLPQSHETFAWSRFGVSELKKEIAHQFLLDGGSFEGSTSYHRLSAEMCLYTLALLSATDFRTELGDQVTELLEKIIPFTSGILKPDGRVPQIGDNDGGRFFRLAPEGLHDDSLRHGHLLYAAAGFSAKSQSQPASFETEITRHLTGGSYMPRASKIKGQCGEVKFIAEFSQHFQAARLECRHVYKINLPQEVDPKTLESAHWPDFGLYVMRNESFYLSIRCDHRQHHSMEGHAHNDLFSLELQAGGQDILRDPGSYVYYPQPQKRNQYRSLVSHFPSQLLRATVKEHFTNLLFTFPNRAAGECLFFSPGHFVGRRSQGSSRNDFALELSATQLTLKMISSAELTTADREAPQVIFSPGYGVLSEFLSYQDRFLVDSNISP